MLTLKNCCGVQPFLCMALPPKVNRKCRIYYCGTCGRIAGSSQGNDVTVAEWNKLVGAAEEVTPPSDSDPPKRYARVADLIPRIEALRVQQQEVETMLNTQREERNELIIALYAAQKECPHATVAPVPSHIPHLPITWCLDCGSAKDSEGTWWPQISFVMDTLVVDAA